MTMMGKFKLGRGSEAKKVCELFIATLGSSPIQASRLERKRWREESRLRHERQDGMNKDRHANR